VDGRKKFLPPWLACYSSRAIQSSLRKEVRKMEILRKILLGLIVQNLRKYLSEFDKNYGEILQQVGIDREQTAILLLKIVKEACDELLSHGKK